MKLILHEMAHSPYCIPIKRVFEAYAVPYEVVAVSSWDRRDLAKLTEGEYYQVPVVEHGDTVVFETAEDPLAVPHYLDKTFTGGQLFPGHCAGLQELVIAHIENDLEGKGFVLFDPHYLDSLGDDGERTMVRRHKERKFGVGCEERWRAEFPRLKEEFEAELDPYETRLAHAPFLFGDQPVYADYALYGVLGNVLYDGRNQLSSRFTHILGWKESLEAYRSEIPSSP